MTTLNQSKISLSGLRDAHHQNATLDSIALSLAILTSNARFYHMQLLDSEPICAILAVSHVHFLRSEKLHICKSNSLEVACEQRWIEVNRPEGVVLELPIYNHSVRQFSEPLQQRRERGVVADDFSIARKSSTA